MRAPTKNEKVLGGVFLAMAVGLGLLLLATSARKWVQQGKRASLDLQARIAEAQQWLDEGALWSAREEWLRGNPLPVWLEDQSEADLIQELQASLGREGISINSQRLLASSGTGGRHDIGAELSLKGTTEQIVRWLHALQKPGEFISIRQINVRADPDKTNLRVDISLVRHYGEGNQPVADISANEPPAEASAMVSSEEGVALPSDELAGASAEELPGAEVVLPSGDSGVVEPNESGEAAGILPEPMSVPMESSVPELRVEEPPEISPEPMPEGADFEPTLGPEPVVPAEP